MSSHDLSEVELIKHCRSCHESDLIGGSKYGNRVVKISNDKVVKFGAGVTFYEKINQQIASELVDAGVVKIPKVYRFFTDDRDWGYIEMEYVQGKMIDREFLTEVHIKKLANILHHFSNITRPFPGSLSGGPSIGLLWPDTNDLFIKSVSHIENWFNSRLFKNQDQVSLQDCKFQKMIFCHLDIAPRNIVWHKDGCIYLLDWASAGFYPRLFEHLTLWVFPSKFNRMLINAMNIDDPISGIEDKQRKAIRVALQNIEKYSL
jgi:serine/threonine protein kinase